MCASFSYVRQPVTTTVQRKANSEMCIDTVGSDGAYAGASAGDAAPVDAAPRAAESQARPSDEPSAYDQVGLFFW